MEAIEPDLPFSAADVVDIRQRLVDAHDSSERTSRGGDAECVEGSMQAALQGAYYTSVDNRPDHIHVASFLLYYIARRHCFTDGNKRTAWAVAVDYFLRQGLMIVADQMDAAQMVEDVVAGIVTKEGVILWFGADNRLQEAVG
jgi:death-on-curing protein